MPDLLLPLQLKNIPGAFNKSGQPLPLFEMIPKKMLVFSFLA
jgi:hypothetical protein